MRLRRLMYYCMNGEKLIERAEENSKRLSEKLGFDEMFNLYDDNYDIIVVLLHKGRREIRFIHYIRNNLDRLLTNA